MKLKVYGNEKLEKNDDNEADSPRNKPIMG